LLRKLQLTGTLHNFVFAGTEHWINENYVKYIRFKIQKVTVKIIVKFITVTKKDSNTVTSTLPKKLTITRNYNFDTNNELLSFPNYLNEDS